MSGITIYGFVRKTLNEVINSMKINTRAKLGSTWNTESGGVLNTVLSVFSEELDQCWQGLEGVYASQTLDGAEGIYLDDILSQQGVYRKGRTASSGKAIIFSNYATSNIGSTINAGATTIGSNNISYATQKAVTLDNYLSCYKLSAAQLTEGQAYSFTAYSTRNPNNQVFNFTPSSEANKALVLQQLAIFINNNILDMPTRAYFDPITTTMYLGFNQQLNLPQPFPTGTLFIGVTPNVGSLGHSVNLLTNIVGFNPLPPNSLTGINPSYTGFESIVNGDDFSAGSEVQTDAEYRLTAINIKETSIGGTTDSIEAGLLALEGVVDARVYENPTEDEVIDLSSNVVALPYTYNVAVLGGDDNEVAQVILNKSPANTKRYGTYIASAINTKGNSVDVNFTKVGYFDVEIEISYTAKNNTVLSEAEKPSIIKNIIEAVSSLEIGSTIPLNLLEAVTFQSVAFSRLFSVSIRAKDLTVVSGEFTDQNLTADYDEKPRVLANKVIFRRI